MAQMVNVSVGDLIVYHTDKGEGLFSAKGAWFKHEKGSDSCSRERPVIARALEQFSYESDRGIPYHSIQFEVVRRFYTDPNRKQTVNEHDKDKEHASHLSVHTPDQKEFDSLSPEERKALGVMATA